MIAGNSHTIAIFLKGEALQNGEPEHIGEVVWIGDVDWTEEAHFIFNFKLSTNHIPSLRFFSLEQLKRELFIMGFSVFWFFMMPVSPPRRRITRTHKMWIGYCL